MKQRGRAEKERGIHRLGCWGLNHVMKEWVDKSFSPFIARRQWAGLNSLGRHHDDHSEEDGKQLDSESLLPSENEGSCSDINQDAPE